MEATVSKRIVSKAERLIEAGKVVRLGPLRYKVEGDYGTTYHVLLSYPEEATGRCTCPSQTRCSHLYAAAVVELSRDIKQAAVEKWSRELADPFDGLV